MKTTRTHNLATKLVTLCAALALLAVWIWLNPAAKSPAPLPAQDPSASTRAGDQSAPAMQSPERRVALGLEPSPPPANSSPTPQAGPQVRSNPLEAPAWAVPYGKEFWRQPAARVAVDPKRSATTNLPASLNVGDVIERVHHALTQTGAGAPPQAAAQTYTASFDGDGLVFSPHKPGDGSADRSADRNADFQSASTPTRSADRSAELHSALDNATTASRLQTGAPDRRHDRRPRHETEADRNVRARAPEKARGSSGGSPLLCGEEPCGIEP